MGLWRTRFARSRFARERASRATCTLALLVLGYARRHRLTIVLALQSCFLAEGSTAFAISTKVAQCIGQVELMGLCVCQ